MRNGVKAVESESVLIIGAGPAGIVQAYCLQRAGIPFRWVDRGAVIAETWASLYPSLRLNTTRFFSHMPHQRFPLRYGIFPTGQQYHAYLVDFARKQGLKPELGVEVTRVTPRDGGYWVETSAGDGLYHNVILATGRFSNPYTPLIPALKGYRGERIHAHDYRNPDTLKGRRILVIGNGPSGMDISIDAGRVNAPHTPALLSMRTGIVLKRRYPLGLPKHAWVILAEHLPARLAAPLLTLTENMGYRRAALRGIKTPSDGQSSGAAATRGPELIHAVRRGQVICVSEPQDSDGRRVLLEHLDGVARWHEVDVVVLATGYQPALGFLDGVLFEVDDQGWPLRDSSMAYHYTRRYSYGVGQETDERLALYAREIRGYAGLFVQGVYYKGKGTTYNINIEAALITEQVAQRIATYRAESLTRA